MHPRYLRERRAFRACASVPVARTLVMVGDSTMRKQFHSLCAVLDGPHARCNNLASTPWRHLCSKTAASPCSSCSGRLGRGHIDVLFYSHPMLNASALGGLDAAGAAAPRVDVVYFGAGLWLLWPTPFWATNGVLWATWQQFVGCAPIFIFFFL